MRSMPRLGDIEGFASRFEQSGIASDAHHQPRQVTNHSTHYSQTNDSLLNFAAVNLGKFRNRL